MANTSIPQVIDGNTCIETHSNQSIHVTSIKGADTLISHVTMGYNPINFIYILFYPGHVTLWSMEVGPLANAREASMQEHDWARVILKLIWNSSKNVTFQSSRFGQIESVSILML